MKKVTIAVEYEATPIRHLAIQCPECGKWFNQGDVCDKFIYNTDELYFVNCKCPICHTEFDLKNVTEEQDANFPEFYEKCMKKKQTVTWE